MLRMSEKTLVVQHNAVVEARYKLTVEEQRLIKTLVSQIQRSDEDFKVYEIRVIDLAKLIGIHDEYYYTRIKKLTKTLRDNSLCFTNENGDEVQTGWLSSAVYRKGKGSVELRFDPVLKPYLLQLKTLFMSYELGNILRLKGMYSIRIYELLKQYETIGRRRFLLEELKHILKIDSEYQQYRDFKKFVLAPSQNEISEKTDISYSIDEIKKGRKVIALIFEIKSKKKARENKAKKATPSEKKTGNQIVDQLVNLGIIQKTAEELVGEYSEEHIQAEIAYAEAQCKEGKVKNLAGFVVEAIRNGYRDNQAEERQRKEEAAKLEADKEAKRKEWEKMKTRWNAWKAEQVKAHIAAMDAEALERERAAFRESFKGSVMAKTVFANQDNEARHFRIYVTGKMEGLGVSEWARAVKVDLSPFIEFVRSE
jgi:plasmid replication initiation protein